MWSLCFITAIEKEFRHPYLTSQTLRLQRWTSSPGPASPCSPTSSLSPFFLLPPPPHRQFFLSWCVLQEDHQRRSDESDRTSQGPAWSLWIARGCGPCWCRVLGTQHTDVMAVVLQIGKHKLREGKKKGHKCSGTKGGRYPVNWPFHA